MSKVALFAMNNGCEIDESRLYIEMEDYLNYKGMEIYDFKYDDIPDMVEEAKENADEIVIAFDALQGMNPNFYQIASYFAESPVKPTLLITNYDLADADVEEAKNAFKEVWLMEEPSLSDHSLVHKVFYYSYLDGFKDA